MLKKYLEFNLGGLPEFQRRRYLEGLWENPEGSFFDDEALQAITTSGVHRGTGTDPCRTEEG